MTFKDTGIDRYELTMNRQRLEIKRLLDIKAENFQRSLPKLYRAKKINVLDNLQMSLGWIVNESIRKSTRERNKGHVEFAVSFFSSCAVFCRLILDDIPAKEAVQLVLL